MNNSILYEGQTLACILYLLWTLLNILYYVEVNDEERMIYEELLTVNPKSCQACLGLGKMDLFKKDFILAEKHFRNGIICTIKCTLLTLLSICSIMKTFSCHKMKYVLVYKNIYLLFRSSISSKLISLLVFLVTDSTFTSPT